MSIIQRALCTGALRTAGSALARLLPAAATPPPQQPLQQRCMAYTAPTGPQRWPRYNKLVYPPTLPEQTPRPAYVCHLKQNVKYSRKKMWYVSSMIRGMSVEEALKQLQLVNWKGAKIAAEAVREAQEMAVRDHNVEFRNNLWVSESFATKAKVVKGLRRHARGRMGIVRYGYIHYFLTLEEGSPPSQFYLDTPLPPEEMLRQWMERRHRLTIQQTL